jgi:hypothetical protein
MIQRFALTQSIHRQPISAPCWIPTKHPEQACPPSLHHIRALLPIHQSHSHPSLLDAASPQLPLLPRSTLIAPNALGWLLGLVPQVVVIVGLAVVAFVGI